MTINQNQVYITIGNVSLAQELREATNGILVLSTSSEELVQRNELCVLFTHPPSEGSHFMTAAQALRVLNGIKGGLSLNEALCSAKLKIKETKSSYGRFSKNGTSSTMYTWHDTYYKYDDL